MGYVLTVIACIISFSVGYFIAESKDEAESKDKNDMCMTCEYCKAIGTNGNMKVTTNCPLWGDAYTRPVTCACYKPRKEEVEN